MENIQNIEEMILTYTNALNETDPEIISGKIDQSCSLTGTYRKVSRNNNLITRTVGFF